MKKAVATLMIALGLSTAATAADGNWTQVGNFQGWPCFSKDGSTAYCGPVDGDRITKVEAICINRECRTTEQIIRDQAIGNWNRAILHGTGEMLRRLQEQEQEQRRLQQQRPPSWHCSTIGSFTNCTPY
jgi:hypothetical protein